MGESKGKGRMKLKLPEEVRHRLKRPFGKLFESTQEASNHLRKIDFEWLVTVGDVVTAELLGVGLEPDVAIFDLTVKRSPASEDRRKIVEDYSVRSVKVENPAGHITTELMNAIRTAQPPLKIIVDGEEDLATLPAVLFAPNGSAVVYGQPDEGLVIVKVSKERKDEFEELLDLFEPEE